jgi:REP element-mobilizing transposase RayT
MRSRYKIHDNDAIYFLTSTTLEWLPVFTHNDHFQILIDSLAYCRTSKGLKIYAYVLLDNHFHLIAQAPDLSAAMQSIKRHTARAIVESLKSRQHAWLLNQIQFYKQNHKTQSAHQLWQEGFHPQRILDWDMLHQKTEYIHNNPVKRGYVDIPEHWRYSSARNYMLDDSSVMEIDELEH